MINLNQSPRPLRAASLILCLTVAVLGSGCGTKSARRDSTPRPALPIVVSALVTKNQIRVAPAEFGAGAIEVLVANRSGKPRRIVLNGNGTVALSTTPISDGESSKAQTILKPGTYTLNAGAGIPAAKLRVGPERPSSQGELITP